MPKSENGSVTDDGKFWIGRPFLKAGNRKWFFQRADDPRAIIRGKNGSRDVGFDSCDEAEKAARR